MNKKLNNKGYMLVEIIVASVIAFSVAYYLLNLTYKFKDKNMDVYESTSLLSNKINITKNIMYDLNDQNVTKITTVNDNNYDLTITNPDKSTTTKRISVNGKTIEYGTLSGDTIIKNDRSYYKKELPNYVDIGKISVFSESKIQIPISDIYSNNTYDINIGTTNLDWTPKYHVFYGGIGGFIGGQKIDNTKNYFEFDSIYNNGNTHSETTTIWKELNAAGNTSLYAKIVGNTQWNNDNLEFFGTANTGAIGAELTIPNEFTLQSTVELKNYPQNNSLYHLISSLKSSCGVGLVVDKDGIPKLIVNTEKGEESISGTSILQKNIKYQIVGTYKNKELRLYINGTLNNYKSSIGGTIQNLTPTPSTITIGCQPNNTLSCTGKFEGKIYDTSFVKIALSADIIKDSSGIDVKMNDNYSILANTNFKREGTGFSIKGWYTDPNYATTSLITDTTKVSQAKDHTIYAKW